MELLPNKILLEDSEDVIFCKSLYMASFNSRPIATFITGEEIEGDDLVKVLRGAARLSLGIEPNGYHGITQSRADYFIGELYGSSDDYVPRICYELDK